MLSIKFNDLAANLIPRTRSKGDGVPPCCICPKILDRALNAFLPSSSNRFKMKSVE